MESGASLSMEGKFTAEDDASITIAGALSVTGDEAWVELGAVVLDGGWFSDSELNMNGRDWTFSGEDAGFGNNTVNLTDSNVAFTDGAVLTNEALITIGSDSTLTADAISFSDVRHRRDHRRRRG